MLYLYESNDLDCLRDRLIGLLHGQVPGPFESRVVVAANNGLFRWLAQGVARAQGVAAMLEHRTPDTFLGDLLASAAPDCTGDCWDGDALVWRIYGRLEQASAGCAYAGLVSQDNAPGRYRLAGRLAELFKLYTQYRMDWLSAWQQGRHVGLGADEAWQTVLWQDLLAEQGVGNPVAGFEQLEQWLGSDAAEGPPLFVFEPGPMSPSMMATLTSLSRRRDVYLLTGNPCQHPWDDIVDYAEQAQPETPDALYQRIGHPLLASLGRQGRGWQRLLQRVPAEDCVGDADYRYPEADGLLQQVQRDILELQHRAAHGDVEPLPARAEDRSIVFHSCHSLQRQLQVLRDQLLALFDTQPDMHLSDVAVMLPDIEQAAPYIHSVFGNAQPGFEYRIVDRNDAAANPYAQVLLELITVARGRFGADSVFGLLERPQIAARFELDADGMSSLRQMVREAGIRWGLDGEHRKRFDLPEDSANTWMQGVQRMLAGFLVPADGQVCEQLGGLLPLDLMDMRQARQAGALHAFLQALRELSRELCNPHTLPQWVSLCQQWLSRFVAAERQDEDRLQDLRQVLERLQVSAGSVPIELDVFLLALHDGLAGSSAAGTLSGALTFSGLQPGRCLPQRVICLLGMDEGAFPGNPARPSFDLSQQFPRVGDRSRSQDDRWLFLQCLMSASDLLYVSYTGHDIRDDSPRPPSVLVSELMDVLDAGFLPPAGSEQERLSEYLTTRHPLQAFSPVYFNQAAPDLFSYSAHYRAQAQALLGRRSAAFSVAGDPLADQQPAQQQALGIDQLIWFLTNPARHWLGEQVGIRLPGQEDLLDDREPFDLSRFERSRIEKEILEALFEGAEEHAVRKRLLATGTLPHGAWGQSWLDAEIETTGEVAQLFRGLLQQPLLPALELNIETRAGSLLGSLQNLREAGLVRMLSGDQPYAGDALRYWVEHLALCAAQGEGYATESWMLSPQGAAWRFVAVDQAGDVLGDLLDLYQLSSAAPVPFFPKAAWNFAQTRYEKQKDHETALREAKKAWFGGFNRGAEADKPEYRYLWNGAPLPEPEFSALAQRVFEPLFAHLETVDLTETTEAGQ